MFAMSNILVVLCLSLCHHLSILILQSLHCDLNLSLTYLNPLEILAHPLDVIVGTCFHDNRQATDDSIAAKLSSSFT